MNRILHANTPAELSKRRTSQRALRILHKRIRDVQTQGHASPTYKDYGHYLLGAESTLQFLLGESVDILHVLGKLESAIHIAHLQKRGCRCAVCRNPLTGLTESC